VYRARQDDRTSTPDVRPDAGHPLGGHRADDQHAGSPDDLRSPLADGRALGLRSEIELARVHIATVTRAEIRLRHRILADQEINTVLAQRLVDFDGALQRGVIPTIALRLVMDE
jgi:hypothetical protein